MKTTGAVLFAKTAIRFVAVALSLALLSACDAEPETLPGTLEWDRVDILAEASEPVVELSVREGERVEAGQLLLRLDPRRTQARLDEARATLRQQQARLEELRHGARPETVDAARAELAQAESDRDTARTALRRARSLQERGALAQAGLDDARNAFDTAEARVNAQKARLTELLHGTRPEQLEQAEAAVDSATARVAGLAISRQRLDVIAPAPGRVDALPHRLGDQPTTGATLVTLLAGAAPYARVFISEPRRASIHPGDRYRVRVDGVDTPFDAVVRSVRSEPAFTPYYALTGDDANRLSYQAELVLQGEAARQLPAGLPCQAWPAEDGDER
ncbi:HlyD family secretion protein [Alloalcanivorax marinus]|uniref:HlyD family secretion protein n=1 Tax=Alloalcanivorax marinus TaxID=1177169 RepID=UPI0019349944|nr:HlyD family efflux transporter periplasmic adaptor subunit [Alloalcanivorax marinus]MBL7249057.1 HlyD family efflux transporter periplasmic adaptor subunit [Alloalcanivorax marinus]